MAICYLFREKPLTHYWRSLDVSFQAMGPEVPSASSIEMFEPLLWCWTEPLAILGRADGICKQAKLLVLSIKTGDMSWTKNNQDGFDNKWK